MKTRLLFAILLVFVKADGASRKSVPTKRLKDDLLANYDSTIRPTFNHTNITTVSICMVLKYVTYEMHSHTITVNNWLVLRWIDEHLQWDPKNYDGVAKVHIENTQIWQPDLSLYNRIDHSQDSTAYGTVDCLIYANGTVVCVPPTRHEALCIADVTKYPYDQQKCILRYGSWVHTGEEIDFNLTRPAVILDSYIQNTEWKLLTVTAAKHVGFLKNSSFPSLNYNFVFERRSGAATATIVMPAVVMILLTITTLCMNANDINRLYLALVNIISHFMHLQNVSWQLPSNGDSPPLIVRFSRDSLLLCTFTLLITIFLRAVLRASKQSPPWIDRLISFTMRYQPGQWLIQYEGMLKTAAAARGEDDGAAIVENSDKTSENSRRTWNMFALIVDRLCLLGFFVMYFYMCIAFLV